MENAAEAIKMAGAVLLFVLALSIILFSFGQVRENADTILNYRDRETMYIDTDYYYEQTGTERNVNLETIIPSVYRAYLERYKVVFDGLDSPIYKIKNKDNQLIEKYTLDLETNQDLFYKNATVAEEQKGMFLKAILYGDFDSSDKKFQDIGISLLGCESLYKQLTDKVVNKNCIITEYLGVYYQSDEEGTPDVNKTQKRVITYKITER